ncbi:Os06g0728300 [Oryza sativa Japonica Group]|uniref:Os06g0728300 protein n=2 Tax=Oryza sativa subsp. japonica TaxID=39947 RepID=Q0D9B7_ORYSJ|nr:hypothetical protein EE612_036595 [Oryza sativa]BAF20556.1 Os06g0728300 [Oryza sativa Japonica Group]BAS99621.1 Os06g0728300 [Oryza sativa Japonica Group]|eukprot:NP_001058642.1 Os06g0728300 [Oryza sativa Japonica Group]
MSRAICFGSVVPQLLLTTSLLDLSLSSFLSLSFTSSRNSSMFPSLFTLDELNNDSWSLATMSQVLGLRSTIRFWERGFADVLILLLCSSSKSLNLSGIVAQWLTLKTFMTLSPGDMLDSAAAFAEVISVSLLLSVAFFRVSFSAMEIVQLP